MQDQMTLTDKLLLASKIRGVGKVYLNGLIKDPLFHRLSPEEWSEYADAFKSFSKGTVAYKEAVNAYLKDKETSQKLKHSIISPIDLSYPSWLYVLNNRPPLLYVKGNLKSFSDKAIAIIGTREPSDHGKVIAERITNNFVEKGWQIISGLALGIDSIAHETTVNACGKTVAILAHGLETIAPRTNVRLAERIVEEGGLLVTEYPYYTPAYASNFVERDTLQAAFAVGVITIQSGLKGGSLHATRAILAMARKLIVPYPTKMDIKNAFENIQANLVIAGDNIDAKMALLRCKKEQLDSVLIMRSKHDYELVEELLLKDIKLMQNTYSKLKGEKKQNS